MSSKISSISTILQAYRQYASIIEEHGWRRPNIPEGLSESLACHILSTYYSSPFLKGNTGDLVDSTGLKYEVKCFSSAGPTSFGPTEEWYSLVFVDLTKYKEGMVSVHEFPYSNHSSEMRNLPVNRKETFEMQAKNGRRPRITFSEFEKYIAKHSYTLRTLYSGPIDRI